MRILCFIAVLFAGTFSAHAQSVKQDRIEAITLGISQNAKSRTIGGRDVAAGAMA